MSGPHRFLAITTGFYHTCGLDASGLAWCWGGDYAGQLGDGAWVSQQAPVRVTGSRTFMAISAGDEHTCALETGARAWCWGSDVQGQLGNGTPVFERASPDQVAGSRTYTQIASGGNHSCALDDAGSAWCGGRGIDGALGVGSAVWVEPEPVMVSGSRALACLTGGAGHTCAVDSHGRAWCRGWDQYGQLGDGPPTQNRLEPMRVNPPF